jgi:predicted transcriptional regulator
MRADLTRHDNEIKENINQIKENRSRLNTVDINQAVTQEQYRQIIDKIDELGRKLDEQR